MKALNFFDFIFSSTLSFNKLFKKLKLDSSLRYLIIILSNVYIRIYFKMFKHTLIKSKYNHRVIVNLTTFPARINSVWLIIEILLRQTVRVEKIILWLSRNQFPNETYLPTKLRKLQSSVFEIRICEGDLRSHKKYYYAFKEYPDYLNITVDDDILYPSTLIEELIELHNSFPKSICCHRAKKVNMFKTSEKYISWDEAISFCGPTDDLFFTSGGGTLYPPQSLYSDVCREDIFMTLCKNADDIWLNSMALLNGTKIVKSKYFSLCLPLLIRNNVKLSSLNLTYSQNDVQIEKVKQHYAI